MLTLSHTILSMSTWARELSKGTLIRKKATMHIRYVLSSRISTNGLIKLSENHSSKLMVDRQKLTTRRHKIDPSKPRIIINKYDIIGAIPV